MAWFRIYNRANAPINVKLTNAGITYYSQNHVRAFDPNMPGGEREKCGYWEFNPGAVGWDFTAVYDTPSTQFDPSKDNVLPISTIVGLTVGIAATAAGVALTVVTAGAAAPIVVAGVQIMSASAALATGATITSVAAAGTVASLGITIAEAVLYPATVNGLYGPDGYAIVVDGGFPYTYDKEKHTLTMEGAKPLAVSWKNNTSGTHGEGAGYTLPSWVW
jgi:hypothetical protein